MHKIILATIVQLYAVTSIAQNTLSITVKDKEDTTLLTGVTIVIPKLDKAFVADSIGLIQLNNLPDGNYKLAISCVGYSATEYNLSLPSAESNVTILLEKEHDEEQEVVVTATRLSRTIANIPTRVEVITGEELDEKSNMRPGEIRMLLSESTGIQVQQTSATSFNSAIRIQGLDGRYTQILKDGYPLFSGFSGSLSIMQTPPLDLKQAEVIKGSASTLYGGGAIAGIVNLVSKIPTKKKEISLLANGSTAGGFDLSGFYSERYKKTGLTLFASRNSNKAFDPANIGLTAIPKFERYTINSRLFLYGKKTTADIGVSYITENRIGGSIDYIKNKQSGFFEKNSTDRITTQIGINHKLSEHADLHIKNSYSNFDRVISIPGYEFDAYQQSSFTELTWNRKGSKSDWVIGSNFLTEDLQERSVTADPKRDYHYNTYGVFAQNAWSVTDRVMLETGLRGDFVKKYGFEFLPRISAMFKITSKLTTRIGGGLGYKAPTIFTEEAERIQFQNLLPVNTDSLKNERSAGVNWDINFKTTFGNVGVTINQLFYYTRLNTPLVLNSNIAGKLEFHNSGGHVDTKGSETNLRLVYHDFKLFIGYTYTDANSHYTENKEWMPLTARHRLNNVLMYEADESWKLGLEAYYYSRQRLTDGSFGRSYWITGFMVEKIFNKVSLFLNLENFTDTRQSKYGPIYTGSIDNPQFADIYAPVEGFVMNGGLKVRL
jgi:outer membrane receptor for ferrienterochelin and colicins